MATPLEPRRQYQKQLLPPRRGKGIHPLVFFIWDQMNKEEWSQEDLAKKSGVSSSAMRKWRLGTRSPRVIEIDAVLGALGYKLKPEEKE